MGLGGWPVLQGGSWSEADFDWKTLTYKLLEVGYDSYFVSVGFGIDLKNNTKRIISVRCKHSTKNVEKTIWQNYSQ